ncbi:amino acid/polyamine transporter I [Aspergillus undulatus]|uniref:amino acid/polyamine transporter I n=1 Tax=Aspergillus undulatus TaxID=1810928 RepID=UPI003CCE3FD6
MADGRDTAPLLGENRQSEYGTVEEAPPVTELRTSFKRNLGTAEAFSIIISIVIGSGIFTSPGSIDTNVPSPGFALIVWLVGGVLAWTGAATMAELGTAIQGEGGVQPYLQYIYGDVFGFLAAWTFIVAVIPASLAIMSIVFVESVYSAIGENNRTQGALHKLLSVLVLIAFSMANGISTKATNRLNRFFVTAKFTAIVATVVAGIGVVLHHLASNGTDTEKTSQDWWSKSWFGYRTSIGPDGEEIDWSKLHGWEMLGHYSAALYGALWAYSGWDKAIYITAELSAPARQLPLAINTAIPVIVVGFIAVNTAYYILLPWDVVSTTDSVAVTAFTHLLGPGVGLIAAVLICLVVAGSLLGSAFVGSRMIVSASNKNWFPRFLGQVGYIGFRSESQSETEAGSNDSSAKSDSDAPLNALILSTLCSTLYIIFGNFRALVTFNGLGEYSFFFLTMVGAIILRFREPKLHRPYKPIILIPIVFTLVSGFVVARGAVFAPFQAIILIAVWGLGLVFYYARRWWSARSGRGC